MKCLLHSAFARPQLNNYAPIGPFREIPEKNHGNGLKFRNHELPKKTEKLGLLKEKRNGLLKKVKELIHGGQNK